uniref:2Fe-2S ferredoxin-type domain-containing protein n=1 Tax=Octactis speculum TaxID=3111310 RepID=A0A7S2E031_9STRA|mmetsp:Transcript_56681/g.77276  ORF Transcript_56681/g.77276 Transcript_56681/m.77276 type:complete len:180 (+) Transcript_56681:150-689(+)
MLKYLIIFPVFLVGAFVPSHRLWTVDLQLPETEELVPVIAVENTPLLLAMESHGELSPPFECRRGNCLNCAAKLLPGSSQNFDMYLGEFHDMGEDKDRHTFLCEEAKEKGFILTCCSYATGPGLKIAVDKSYEAYQVQYHERFKKKHRAAATAASAVLQTVWAEENTAEWLEMVENQFG